MVGGVEVKFGPCGEDELDGSSVDPAFSVKKSCSREQSVGGSLRDFGSSVAALVFRFLDATLDSCYVLNKAGSQGLS